jgi:hypothetical protein
MEDDYMSDEDYNMLEHYLEIGAIEVEGVNEDGEIIFSMSEKAQEIAPELWQAHVQFVDNTLIKLYEDGLINVEYDENLEATIMVSEEAKDMLSQLGLIELEEE